NVQDTKGILTALSADLSAGVLSIRASNDSAGQTASADKLVLTASAAPALTLGGTSKLELTLNIQDGAYANQYTPLLQTSGGTFITARFASVVCKNNPGLVIGSSDNPQMISVVYTLAGAEVDPLITAADTVALRLNTPGGINVILTPTTLPNPQDGAAYTQNVTAGGGTAPYTFAVTAGALPSGLTLSSAGVISGTTSLVGNFNVTITATDSSTGTGPFAVSTSYTLTVSPPPISV